MFVFIIRRLLAVIPVLFVVSLVVFILLRLTPGDPATVLAGDSATMKEIEMVRESLGLNRSIYVQYGIWVGNLLRGDLGFSFFFDRPVGELILARVEPTLALAAGTLLLSTIIAIPLGTIAGWKMGGLLDRLLSGFAISVFSFPLFVVGYLLIYVFSIRLQILPVQGYVGLADAGWSGIWEWMRQLVLPWLALSSVFVALLARVTRASVSEVLTEDFIRTARAKGLLEVTVLVRHALANSAVPIVTVIGSGVSVLIGGVVVTETIFVIPGMGSLTVDAVLQRDFPVIQGVVMVFSVIYVMINLLIDISYLFLDPRIRY